MELDRTCGGLILGHVTLLSGKRGEGKSTFMSQIVAEAIEQGNAVFVYSGELPNYHFKNWLDLQIAGGNHIETEINKFGDEEYYLTNETVEKINKWFYKVYFTREYEKGSINFYYMNITTSYLKEKYNVDFDKIKDILLAKLNYAQKLAKEDTFETLEDYLEYIVNKGLDEQSLDRVYNWIVKQ